MDLVNLLLQQHLAVLRNLVIPGDQCYQWNLWHQFSHQIQEVQSVLCYQEDQLVLMAQFHLHCLMDLLHLEHLELLALLEIQVLRVLLVSQQGQRVLLHLGFHSVLVPRRCPGRQVDQLLQRLPKFLLDQSRLGSLGFLAVQGCQGILLPRLKLQIRANQGYRLVLRVPVLR